MLRKSIIKLLLFQLFGILLIVKTVNCYGLGNVGTNNNNNSNNNDKESHSTTTTLGSSVPPASTAVSTATSIISEYLATFAFSDSQSPQTTDPHHSTLGPGDWSKVFDPLESKFMYFHFLFVSYQLNL